MAISRVSGLQGAMPTPQLPITTLVTPCHDEGVTGAVPTDLRVVVGMRIDEARRDDQPVGVDGALGAFGDLADLGAPCRRRWRRRPDSAPHRCHLTTVPFLMTRS